MDNLYTKIEWVFGTISGELISTRVPFPQSLEDFHLTAFMHSLYAAVLLSYFLLGGGRWATSMKTTVLGWILVAGGGFLAMVAQNFRMLVVGRVLFGVGIGFVVRSGQVSTTVKYKEFFRTKAMFRFLIMNSVIAATMINDMPTHHLDELSFRLTVVSLECIPLAMFALAYWRLGLPDPVEDEEKAADQGAVPLLIMHKDELAAGKSSSAWANFSYLVAALAVPLLMQKLTPVNLVSLFYPPLLFQAIVFGSDASLLSSVLIYEVVALVFQQFCHPI